MLKIRLATESSYRRVLIGLHFAWGIVARAAPGILALDALITVAEALAPLAMLQGTRALLDALAAGRPPWAGLALLTIGEAIPAFGSKVVYGPVGAALTRRIDSALRPRVMAALTTMPWLRLEDPAAQDRFLRIEEGILAVDVALDSGTALVRDIGRCVSAVGFLATVSPWAAVSAAAALVPAVLLRRVAAVEWEAVRLSQIPAQRLANYLFTLLTERNTAAEVRLFGYAGYIRRKWLHIFRQVQRAELREQFRTALRGQLAGVTGTALLLVSAALILGHGGAGAIASGVWALTTAFQQTSDLSYWAGSLTQEGLNAANLAEVLAWGRALRPWFRPRRVTRPSSLHGQMQNISDKLGVVAALRQATFTYPGGSKPAVCDLSVEIRAHERVALVGRNGSGKSTAVKLLLGLLDPDSGDALPARRAGVVLQDFGRYALTVQENVGIGRPSEMHARHRVLDAMHRVGLGIAPEQPLGHYLRNGTEPSGGQWQRLALARALRSGASLLVLDEPTAALDPLAEAGLYQDVARAAEFRTVVLVTHRLAAARVADRIIVFEDGHVVQEGTHATLLADPQGLYSRMWAAQSGWAQ